MDNTPAEAASIPAPRDLVDHRGRRAAAVTAGLFAAAVPLVTGFAALLVERRMPGAGFILPAAAAVAAAAFALAYGLRWSGGDDGDADDDDRAARARGVFFFAAALVAPLALHGLMQVWTWAPLVEVAIQRNRSFGAWVSASMMYVPHTHLVFAGLWATRAFRGGWSPSLWWIGGITVAVTALDCLLWGPYGLLPTGYVAFTVVVLLPLLRWLERVVDDGTSPSCALRRLR